MLQDAFMNSGIINPSTYVSCPSYWSGLQIPTNPPRYKCNTQLKVVRVTYPDELDFNAPSFSLSYRLSVKEYHIFINSSFLFA